MDDRTTIAAMALHGLLAGNAGEGYSYAENLDSLPRSAVDYADRLLVELKKDSPAPAQQDATPPAPTGQDAGDVVCKCGSPRSAHAGGLTFCTMPDSWCLKFQPAERPEEQASGAETECRENSALPELRDAGRGVPVGTESSDHHGGPDGRDGATGGGVRGSGGAEPGGAVLQPGGAVQRGAEAGALELASKVLKDSHEDAELRDQVASVEASTSEGPAHAPEQDREAGVQRPAGSEMPGDGATASPAAAKWGRVADPGAAWHRWQEAVGEAECGETTDAELEFIEGRPDPEIACITCADLEEWDGPGKLLEQDRAAETTASSESPKLVEAAPIPEPPANGKRPCARCTKPTKRVCGSESTIAGAFEPFRGKPLCFACGQELRPEVKRCAGHNKSADVPCNTAHVHVEHDGKWWCKRHSPLKPKKARPAQEAAA